MPLFLKIALKSSGAVVLAEGKNLVCQNRGLRAKDEGQSHAATIRLLLQQNKVPSSLESV